MIYKVYIADGAGPKTGLSPTWEYLLAIDGTDKSGSAPAISEIGGGWYKFTLTYGTAPWDVAELVGVIDAGSTIMDAQRYIPVVISNRDFAFAFLAAKREKLLANGIVILFDTDGSTEVARYTPSADATSETLTPGAPS